MKRPTAPSVRDKQVRTVACRVAMDSRRRLAEHALVILDDDMVSRPQPWHRTHDIVRGLRTSISRAEHIAENSPAHVLAVLDIHAALLDAVALHSVRCDCDACAVADLLLDLYAPEQSS
jgi:hypothetical protein